MPLSENSDGTLWIKISDMGELPEIQAKLTALGVPIAALSPDSGCDTPVTVVRWSEMYPKIVPRSGPEPGIVVDPEQIPNRHALLLAVQPLITPGRDPEAVTILHLIEGPPPRRLGVITGFTQPPTPPGSYRAKAHPDESARAAAAARVRAHLETLRRER